MANFASEDDINVHLPLDKIQVDSARYTLLELDAQRIVRGYLAGYIDAATIATWVDPSSTPELIRAIAGRLVAAFYYRERYSEDSLDDPQFAIVKYQEAIAWLVAIQMGTMDIGTTVDGGLTLEESDFYPNDTVTDEGPFFTMTMEL